MASLFKGTPATSYTTSTTETPRWMQDAIYSQIQSAGNIANTPYQPYQLPTVAALSTLQDKAITDAQANQGNWQSGLTAAQTGMTGLSTGTAGVTGATPYANYAADMVKGLDYGAAKSALSPYVTQATGMSGVAAAQPYLDQASGYTNQAGSAKTANQLRSEQAGYLNQALASQGLQSGQGSMNQAGQSAGNIFGSAQPYMNQAGQTTAQSLSERALAAANPYLQAASGSAAGGIGQYMSPYQTNVMDAMGRQAGRNLSENILPNVADSFIKAGQFGSSRMGEFGSRAVRDTQEALLNQQAQLANQGYGQALGASQADLARQAQLAGTVGSISGADLSRVLQGAGQYGNLAQTQGQLTGQQASALTNLGQAQTSAGQAQQQFGLSAAQSAQVAQQNDLARQMQAGQQMGSLGSTMGGLTQAQQQVLLSGGKALSDVEAQALGQRQASAAQAASLAGTMGGLAGTDANRQASALSQMANMAQQQQQQSGVDVASLSAAGQQQQMQRQAELTAAQRQYQEELMYPRQQLDWMNTQIRGMAPITPQTQYATTTGNTGASPLTQLAGAGAAAAGIYKMANQ